MNKEYYTANLKQQIAERQLPIDTTSVQLNSLIMFMERLGYDMMKNESVGTKNIYAGGFRRDDKWYYTCKHITPEFISFSDAVRLHNYREQLTTVREGMVSLKGFQFIFYIPNKFWEAAKESKLVEQIKLQRNKASMLGFEVQNHWVKFVEDK